MVRRETRSKIVSIEAVSRKWMSERNIFNINRDKEWKALIYMKLEGLTISQIYI